MGGDAMYYGLNALSNNMILLDRKQSRCPNGLVFGTPGSGKSMSCKREITFIMLMTQDNVIICDPEDEYSPLVRRLGGQVIRLSPSSTDYVNPLDINLNYSDEENPLALKSDFVLSFCELIMGSKTGLEAIEKTPLHKPLTVWLKLDSGMHRLGLDEAMLCDCHARLQGAAQVAELNLLSHFACADERGHSLTEVQLECFLDLLDLDFDQRSLANSAAVLMIPAAHMDWLRPGIMLYGASPFADLSAAELGLKPAMTLSAQLIAVREVAVGESVGYGAGWVAERPSRIGTVSCGYADGYPRHAPSGTPLYVGGRRAALAGRVSMDMLSVDLTDLPEAAVGDAVELWGANLPVDEVAHAAGTIGYELLTKVTARVPRRYKA